LILKALKSLRKKWERKQAERERKTPLAGKGPEHREDRSPAALLESAQQCVAHRQQSSRAEQCFHSDAALVREDNGTTTSKCGGSKVTPENMTVQRERFASLGKVDWHHRPHSPYPPPAAARAAHSLSFH